MKPILKKENKDVILTSEITSSHIVVGLRINLNNYPVILTKENYDTENYKLTLFNVGFTRNNGYGSFESIQELVEYYLESGWRLEVFHEKDWKQALQWLIDNAE